MRLRDGRPPSQTPLADVARADPFAGQFDEALAEFGDVKAWNGILRLRLYFYQK